MKNNVDHPGDEPVAKSLFENSTYSCRSRRKEAQISRFSWANTAKSNSLLTSAPTFKTGSKSSRRARTPAHHFGGGGAALWVALALVLLTHAGAAESPRNFFANPSFELGRDGWRLDKAGKTECQFSLDEKDAADGQRCARLTMGSVEEWGVQFGQSFPAGEKGKTYTFAVFAKGAKNPIEVGLQIERSANPWDRAAGAKFELTDHWQELHVTFTVEKEFPQGWFAYLSCTQPKVQFCADRFRLYEGPFIPYQEVAQEESARVAVRLFDTRTDSAAPLPGEALSRRTGWAEVPEDDLTHSFKGDAVVMNDRVACVLRRNARGAEVYSIGLEGVKRRTLLAPATGAKSGTLTSFTIVENNPGAGAVDAGFTTAAGEKMTLRYELKVGQPVVQTEARGGVTSLRVEAPCRFAVMPDFFADDIVIDAADLTVTEAELPSDNFFIHLLPDGQAMVMTVVKTSEEDLRVTLSGRGDARMIDRSELRYGKDGRIWVAVLAGAAIWHRQDITREQAGNIIALDWKVPFPAQWRTDWRRQENLTDSWEMIAERPDGQFTKYGLYGGPDTIPANRKRWTTVLGEFQYPCWVDQRGQGYLQPLKTRALRFQGPALIYPINRVPATALDTFTVVDIVRNTLGVGPCEYILDVEGQRSAYRGRATCSVRDTLNPIYAGKQQTQRRAEIEKVLVDLLVFIRHIRGRIEGYVTFGHSTLAYLAEQKKANPELAERLGELEALAHRIDAQVAARKDKIKTPDQVAEMVAEFRQTVLDYEGDDALAKCQRFTEGWVEVGGNQDELVGECRWAVKMLRQRAGLLMATDPRVAEVAKEIRRRSQIVLRNPAGHEGAGH